MAETKPTLEDWLDDLCVRFIINVPREDLSSVERICFQVEEAQWFYEDFIRPLDPTLPSMPLRTFCLRIFQHCPLLAAFPVENHMRAFEEFLLYKTRVPVRGAIMLNEAMDTTVLVKGWRKGANWSFPRGKINKDEDDLDCAIREVYEETGFDIRDAGLVPANEDVKFIQISIREQQIRLYVFRNVPMDTPFCPKTRKEISKIEWYLLSELPAYRKKGNNQQDEIEAASRANKFYMVAPFLVPLKKWVVQQKKKDAAQLASLSQHLAAHQVILEEPLTEDDVGAQTDGLVGPAPASSLPQAYEKTIEGANRELQRLMQNQSPIQAALPASMSEASAPDMGEALMAILQRSSQPSLAPTAQASQLPHALAGQHNPAGLRGRVQHRHHPVQGPPDHNQRQPSSNFAVQPRVKQQSAAAHYSQPPAGSEAGQINSADQQEGHVAVSQQPPHQEPVLLHPQPLPPQVQQSILARDMLPTPKPAAENMGAHPGGRHEELHIPSDLEAKLKAFVTQNYGPDMVPQTRAPAQQLYQQQLTAKTSLSNLSEQKLSLLDVLKSSRPRNQPAESSSLPQNAAAPSQPPSHQLQRHQNPAWANQPAPPSSAGLPQNSIQNTASFSAYGSGTGSARLGADMAHAASASLPPAQPTTQAHRSTLLSMFKTGAPSPTENAWTQRLDAQTTEGKIDQSAQVAAARATSLGSGALSPAKPLGMAPSIQSVMGGLQLSDRVSPPAHPGPSLSYRPVPSQTRSPQHMGDNYQGHQLHVSKNQESPLPPQAQQSHWKRSSASPRGQTFAAAAPKDDEVRKALQSIYADQAVGVPSTQQQQQQQQQQPPPQQQQKILAMPGAASQTAASPSFSYQSLNNPSGFHQQQQQQQSRRRSSNQANAGSEQRQKLLSLFGKPYQPTSPSPLASSFSTSAVAGSPGNHHVAAGATPPDRTMPTMHEQQQQQQQSPGAVGTTTRSSRLASFTSAAGGHGYGGLENMPGGGGLGNAGSGGVRTGSSGSGFLQQQQGQGSGNGESGPVSRRGSQTPISPADRDFLLSYLQTVSSVGR